MSSFSAINQMNSTAPPDPNTIPGGEDPDEIMVEVSLARYGVIQSNLTTQANEIKANNNLLTEYQEVLEQLDSKISTDPNDDGPVSGVKVTPEVYNELLADGLIKSVDSAGDDDPKTGLMLPSQDGTYTVTLTSGQKAAAAIKDKIQTLSNNSQMAMIELQSQMNNLNQTMETATSIMQKASDTKDKIIQNIH